MIAAKEFTSGRDNNFAPVTDERQRAGRAEGIDNRPDLAGSGYHREKEKGTRAKSLQQFSRHTFLSSVVEEINDGRGAPAFFYPHVRGVVAPAGNGGRREGDDLVSPAKNNARLLASKAVSLSRLAEKRAGDRTKAAHGQAAPIRRLARFGKYALPGELSPCMTSVPWMTSS